MASQQRGIVCLADVRAAKLDKDAVRRRVDAELMHPMFPGTWAWGHRAVTREAWFLAATLSVGFGARLAGPSACQLYGVYARAVRRIHLLSARRVADPHPWLVLHHTPDLPPMRRVKGIPVVPVEEALLGLAASRASDRDVRRAIRQAQVEKLTTHAKLHEHARHARGRPGIRRFRRLVGDRPTPTRSELEDAAVDLLRRYGLDPKPNAIVDGHEADLLLNGLIIELDSETFHDNPLSARQDTHKQNEWEANGRRVERLTWDDVHATPVATIRRLARASRATRSSPPPA